jgi:phosphonate transport system substrate-binding protein
MIRFFAILVCMLCLVGAEAFTHPPIAAAPLLLAVHPYLPDEELTRRYAPLADYLRKKTGRAVAIKISRSYAEHEMLVGRDNIDIAFMGPASYVKMRAQHGPKPLLARLAINGRPHFKGAIITRRDSSLTSLQALKHRRFAFGDAESTMSYLVPRYLLQQVGIGLADLESYQLLGSHTNVVLGVLAGDFDAGAVKQEIYQQYRDSGLRVLAWSPEVSEHLFVTRADLPAAHIQTLREALLTVHHTAAGLAALNSIKEQTSALVPVLDSDYDSLRGMLRKLSEESR